MAEQTTTTDEQKAARQRLSANLKLFRSRHGLSQEALADLAGLHRTYVSQVERQVVNVSLDNIVLLAEAMGVQVVDLLKEPEGVPIPLKPGPRSKPADAPSGKKPRRKEI